MPRMVQTRWLLLGFSACVLLGSPSNVLAQSANLQGSFQGPKNAGIDVTADPSYRRQLDNSSVRAFLIAIEPAKSTRIHWHDYEYIRITPADTTVGELAMKAAI